METFMTFCGIPLLAFVIVIGTLAVVFDVDIIQLFRE